MNVNLGYRWSSRSMVAMRYRYGSNFPIAGYFTPAGNDVHLLTSSRNTARLPAYSRLDIRADRTFTFRRSRLTLFAEVVNVLNRENYRAQSASITLATREIYGLTEGLFPLLPSAGLLIEF
jgi:outer membrane receptor protein involved in Fe transport